jgi:hypothetical protein
MSDIAIDHSQHGLQKDRDDHVGRGGGNHTVKASIRIHDVLFAGIDRRVHLGVDLAQSLDLDLRDVRGRHASSGEDAFGGQLKTMRTLASIHGHDVGRRAVAVV